MAEDEITTERENPPPPQEPNASPGRWSLLQVSTVVYAAFAVIGWAIARFVHGNLAEALQIPEQAMEMGRLVGAGVLGAGILLVFSHLFEGWFASYRDVKNAMVRVLGPVSVFVAIYLAAVSAIGEELLFRAAIQPFAGLIITSILFGLLHVGPAGDISSWSIWAVFAGLLLGWMFEETGSIWPPIIAHFGVNCFSILNLRRQYMKLFHGPSPESSPTPKDE